MNLPYDNDPFPLALTPFEHYMLADDSDTWPMTVAIRLRLLGTIDRARLKGAVTKSLASHPLLRATIDGDICGPTRKLRWMAFQEAPQIREIAKDQPAHFHRRLDLQKEAGLRLYIVERSGNTDLIVQWHHACCDGVGILNFINSLFVAYREQDPVCESSCHAADQRLDWWENRGANQAPAFRQWMHAPHHVARIVNFFANRTVPLASENDVPEFSPMYWGNDEYCAHTVSHDETSRIFRKAKEQGVTFNDFILQHFYITLMEWNLRHGSDLGRQKIRVAIPINLRSTKEHEPAINHVSMVFLDRSEKEIRDRDGLLKSLSREIRNVKKWQTGWALIHALRFAGLLRHGMPRIVTTGGPSVTSVLSNLGKTFTESPLLDEAGRIRTEDFSVDRVEPFAPVRKGVVAAVDVLTYANQLTLTLNYDRATLSFSAAEALLQLYVNTCKNS